MRAREDARLALYTSEPSATLPTFSEPTAKRSPTSPRDAFFLQHGRARARQRVSALAVVLGLHSGAKRRTATRTCAAPAAPTPPWRTGSRPCLRGAARARQRRAAGARGRSAFCQAGTDTHTATKPCAQHTRAVVVRHLLARRRRVDGRGAVVGEDDALRLRVGGGGVGVLMPTSSVRQLRAARRASTHTPCRVSRAPRTSGVALAPARVASAAKRAARAAGRAAKQAHHGNIVLLGTHSSRAQGGFDMACVRVGGQAAGVW